MKGKKDIKIGKKFGRLTIIEIDTSDNNRHVRVRCKCDCGNIKTILWSNIKLGKTISCGCYFKERSSKSLKLKNIERLRKKKEVRKEFRKSLVGKIFGLLTIKNIIVTLNKRNYENEETECVCRCGNNIKTRLYNILNGHTKSCGCLKIFKHQKGEVGFRLLYYRYKNRAKYYYNNEFELTKEDFKKLTQQNCFYCGSKPISISKSKSENSEYIYNGLDRIDTNRGYLLNNVVPCCEICNRMKLDHSIENFKKYIINIYNHLNLGEKS